jgi:hypothetical protein
VSIRVIFGAGKLTRTLLPRIRTPFRPDAE